MVTGAGSGIGAAVAEALAAEGYHLVLCGRNVAALDAVAARVATPAHVLALDVSDAGSVETVLQRLPVAFAAISVLINGAGHDVGGRRAFQDGAADDWADIIETNLVGLIRLTRAVCAPMVARGEGDIVNIGSLSAIRPAPRIGPYAASKAGVHMLSDILRADLGPAGVRVIEILPGLTRTGFADARLRGDAGRAAEFYDKAPDCLSPADVARATVFALSQPRNVIIAQMVVMPAGQW
jgi:NADP-dependent 3-hydroxy acid dehydrogenase YdfG